MEQQSGGWGTLPCNVGDAYAFWLVSEWYELVKEGAKFRAYVLARQDTIKGSGEKAPISPDVIEETNKYIAHLTRYFGEIYAIIEKRPEHYVLKKDFDKFMHYYFSFERLRDEEHQEDLFRMEKCLRTALQQLKITEFNIRTERM